MKTNYYTLSTVLKTLLLAVILLFLLFPLYWMLITSLKTNMETYRFPPDMIPLNPTAQNYINLFTKNANFFVYYKNNFIVAGSCALFTMIVALLGGYSLSRFHFRWNKWVVAILLSSQMFPIISRMISLYSLMGKVGLINTLSGLIMAVTAAQIPFSVVLMSSFCESLPTAIEEAAYVDGASRFSILFRIVLPLLKPGILAVSIYSFLVAWDDYLHAATLVQNDALRTLSVGVSLRYLGELSYDWALVNTISIVGTLPMVLIFFFFQKYMVKGLVAGAVKG